MCSLRLSHLPHEAGLARAGAPAQQHAAPAQHHVWHDALNAQELGRGHQDRVEALAVEGWEELKLVLG